MFPSSETKPRPDLIFVDEGGSPLSACYLSHIYISQPSCSQRVSEQQRGRGQVLQPGRGQRWASPRVSPPLLPAGPREDPRDLATLVLSFSCIDPSAFNMGELCRPSSSAQLPASLENVKALYPHPSWNLPETNISNQDRTFSGNGKKVG